MWLLFAAVGYLFGEASSGLGGAVLGGMLGYLLTRLKGVEGRLRALEARPVAQTRTAQPADIPVAEPPVAHAAGAAGPPDEAAPAELTLAEAGVAPAGPGPAVPTRPPVLAWSGDLFGRLLSGNLLAKLGMLLLFFGIASALRLAVEHGLIPPALRLALAALAGLAAIWLGAGPAGGRPFRPAWLLRFAPASEQARQGFGFALEGGGFGILYITAWFALEHYGYLSPAAAFLLFAGLGAACLALAVRQDSQSLALLGLVGGFLAPMLVPGQGEHRVLFGYLVLLDACVLYVSLLRAWRLLIATSLAFSVAIGLAWTAQAYRIELRADVETLLLILFALYSAAPWLAARRGPPAQWGWQSGLLLFGPATAAAALQAALYAGELGFLALSSLGAGVWYGLLHHLARPTGDALLGQAQVGLALAFLSLAPWLAFSQNVAGVFWALEGAGVVWFAVRSGRGRALLAGALLQLLSGLLLLDLWQQGPAGLPLRGGLFHASLLLAAAGILSAWATRTEPLRHRLFLAWSLAWWFGTFLAELGRAFNPAQTWVLMTVLATASAAGLEWAGRRLTLADPRAAALLLLPALGLALGVNYLEDGHPLANGLWLVLPAALGVHYLTLWRQEADGLTWLADERHLLAYWLTAWALAWEAAWLAGQFPALGRAIPEAARALLLGAAVLLPARPWTAWPFAARRALYLRAAPLVPALLAWLWLFSTPIGLTGAWPLPYVPLFNPLEGAAMLLLWALYRHWRAAGGHGRRYPALFGLALLFWLSQMLARVVHHWAGVPFLAEALWHSALLQALLSLGWTAFGLLAMVAASRRRLRTVWFAGLGLLLLVCVKLVGVDLANVTGLLRVLSLIGVGLLVLGAGYLAPVPPRVAQADSAG